MRICPFDKANCDDERCEGHCLEEDFEAACKEEREACAKIADAVEEEALIADRDGKERSVLSTSLVVEQGLTAARIASAIRARGEAADASKE